MDLQVIPRVYVQGIPRVRVQVISIMYVQRIPRVHVQVIYINMCE
jgi:hypothetical protein